MQKNILIVFGVIALVAMNVYSYDIKWDDAQAKVGYIFQREYYETVLELIHKAKKEIVMSMYFIDDTKRGDEPVVTYLVDALINARKRGVKVKVILENTVGLNKKAYARMNENNIQVFWDHNSQITHSKLIVIDNRLVLIGSTNWTERAFRMNNEAAVVIESEKLAQTALAELNKQKIMDVTGSDTLESKNVIFLPKEFLINPSFGPKMVSTAAERAFDLYLVLLFMSQEM